MWQLNCNFISLSLHNIINIHCYVTKFSGPAQLVVTNESCNPICHPHTYSAHELCNRGAGRTGERERGGNATLGRRLRPGQPGRKTPVPEQGGRSLQNDLRGAEGV